MLQRVTSKYKNPDAIIKGLKKQLKETTSLLEQIAGKPWIESDGKACDVNYTITVSPDSALEARLGQVVRIQGWIVGHQRQENNISEVYVRINDIRLIEADEQ